MTLSCTCTEYEGEPGEWGFYFPEDFTPLNTKRRKRCASCGRLINIGEGVLEFPRFRAPKNDIEDRIYGEGAEIPIATMYHCEQCGEIYLNLTAAGYCLTPNDAMDEALEEYWDTTGFKPEAYKLETP